MMCFRTLLEYLLNMNLKNKTPRVSGGNIFSTWWLGTRVLEGFRGKQPVGLSASYSGVLDGGS